ncbi:sensor histidine kinase [Sporosalibacterium faouarense]|uniref:sensor histidine kinase n=1 Tax=Sporosalibacterium faouarense TaxID=516123 RepID=UPI00141D3E21|nr:HAMP domain-containing sensor histidine kinase [Sporosalibacterium faouarense]MTI46221.1 HAMP domain-containing histidine kinase [Bacillota bacterium]
MGTRLKKFSYSCIAKTIAFLIVVVSFSGALGVLINYDLKNENSGLGIIYENNYFEGYEFRNEVSSTINNLIYLNAKYKNEEYIKEGKTINKEEIERRETELFYRFRNNSIKYDPNLSRAENYKIFQEEYEKEIEDIKNDIIEEDLDNYNNILRKLEKSEGIVYCYKNKNGVLTNSSSTTKDYFKSFPSYVILSMYDGEVYPKEVKESQINYWIKSNSFGIERSKDSIYIALTDDYLETEMNKWIYDKELAMKSLYWILGLALAFLLALIYLLVVIGRNSQDKKLHLNTFDRLYVDINLILCGIVLFSWVGFMNTIGYYRAYEVVIPITIVFSSLGLLLFMSLIKHIKNKTFLRHTFIYNIGLRIAKFVKDLYNSGSVGVKIILIVIGYPILVALTFFMFPVTIGVAVWLALKKVKEFNSIKQGVEEVKNGNLYHKINVKNNGEFGELASNINSITDGLSKAVDNELKSERLKTELISNVSHDIRTPLTSIITYIDLLKNEKDTTKVNEYTGILERKAQRLKTLTDDLFEASKVTSGNVPVNYEKIDIISLITQGLGELDDKIKESKLDFKINYPNDKVFMRADGKLIWRSIENLLSNIFKYALEKSRVYIDIKDLGNQVSLTIKNISAYELNISEDELMERFTRGDESRTSQGSGLGLSIAKSLIELQGGNFNIAIDGDLFKAIVILPKWK